jgi:hypothetical protein
MDLIVRNAGADLDRAGVDIALIDVPAFLAGFWIAGAGAAGAQRRRFLRKKIIASATAGMAISASQRISSRGIPP